MLHPVDKYKNFVVWMGDESPVWFVIYVVNCTINTLTFLKYLTGKNEWTNGILDWTWLVGAVFSVGWMLGMYAIYRAEKKLQVSPYGSVR
jgi:hypothetical protein